MPLIMQYFIVFKAFKALSYWVYIFVQWLLEIIDADRYIKSNSFCIIVPIFSSLSKKTNKPPKPTGLGFFKKAVFFWTLVNEVFTGLSKKKQKTTGLAFFKKSRVFLNPG